MVSSNNVLISASNFKTLHALIIRKGSIQDLPELQALFTQTIQHVCSSDYTPEQIQAWTAGVKNTEKWLDIISGQLVLVAETAHQIVGFATLYQDHLIDLLYVHHLHQRQGIAQRLFSALEKEAKQQNQSVLVANVSKTAVPFFKANGFEIMKEQTNLRQNVELVNYLMQKQL